MSTGVMLLNFWKSQKSKYFVAENFVCLQNFEVNLFLDSKMNCES